MALLGAHLAPLAGFPPAQMFAQGLAQLADSTWVPKQQLFTGCWRHGGLGALWWVLEPCRVLGLVPELQPLGGKSEESIDSSATEVAGGGNAGDKQSSPRVRRLPAAECLSK